MAIIKGGIFGCWLCYSWDYFSLTTLIDHSHFPSPFSSFNLLLNICRLKVIIIFFLLFSNPFPPLVPFDCLYFSWLFIAWTFNRSLKSNPIWFENVSQRVFYLSLSLLKALISLENKTRNDQCSNTVWYFIVSSSSPLSSDCITWNLLKHFVFHTFLPFCLTLTSNLFFFCLDFWRWFVLELSVGNSQLPQTIANIPFLLLCLYKHTTKYSQNPYMVFIYLFLSHSFLLAHPN